MKDDEAPADTAAAAPSQTAQVTAAPSVSASSAEKPKV
jgi:hypothetical protein